MKKRYIPGLVLLGLMVSVNSLETSAQTLQAVDIIRKADEKFNGEKSSFMIMTMTIIRPTWQRSIEFKNWSLGRDYALTLITTPAKDMGQTFLKRNTGMWNWNPVINRLIKLPPSMMSQGWMGSDYTNDDILKESSVVTDYDHEIIGEETIQERLRWVDKKDFLVMKAELYDEDGSLVRTETGSEIKTMDGRMIPARLELQPAGEPGNKTVVVIKDIKFNIPLQEGFFSQQNMKNVR
jgi:outer membrane lipoprotein-sorting protein